MSGAGLGRRPPTDWRHVERHPLRATAPPVVERTLPLPSAYRPAYNQGEEGACVGFAWSWAMSILNRRFYDAFWLYGAAQRVDEWPGEDYDGTSVRAGGDVLRLVGHKRLHRHRHTHDPRPEDGIDRNEWGTTVDDVRACIADGVPVVLGINWYSAFDAPEIVNRQTAWIGRGDLGWIRGGHAICCYGASDRRQAVKLVNSWGRVYPLVWLPYNTLGRLLNEYGEATKITDRAV